MSVIRDCGKKGDAPYELDRALLLYKCKASTRITSSEEDTLNMMARHKKSRKNKCYRVAKQKRDYEKLKKRKSKTYAKRTKERGLLERPNLEKRTAMANASSCSVKIADRQCGQFGAFLSMYAMKNNLIVPTLSTEMPSSLPSLHPDLYSNILSLLLSHPASTPP